jgi:hypothetical protein
MKPISMFFSVLAALCVFGLLCVGIWTYMEEKRSIREAQKQQQEAVDRLFWYNRENRNR